MKSIGLIILILCLTVIANAQNPVMNQITEDLLESAGENMSDDTDIQEILDDLEGFLQNPLKINQATKDDLMRLHLLSDVQVDGLLKYREKTGTIYSLFELIAIDGFTPEFLQKMEPFVSFDVMQESIGKKRSSTDLLARSTRIFNSEPTDQDKYEGSPERFYFRVKHFSNRFEYGLVTEKDPGEAFFRGSNNHGFDYTSAYANVSFGGNEMYFGDYHARFGQGLVLWQGFSMGKSAETTQIFRSQQGIHSYSSTDENQFFRGTSAKLTFRNFTFSPFVSLHQIDANLDTINNVPTFGAFQTSGYHRSGSELTGENSLEQFATGAHTTYSVGSWSVGVTAVYNRFDAYMDRSDEPYNQFLPEGKEHFTAGLDWKGSLKKVFFFGEAALSKNSGKAILTGIMMNPTSNAEFSLLYRNINKSYFSFFANAFSESSRVNDEQGLYLGLKVYPASSWIVQAYADLFRHQWLKYTTAAPSSGTEYFVQVSYNPSRMTGFYLRLFQEEKGQRLIDGMQRYNVPQMIKRARFNFSHDFNEQISTKSRLEFSFYSKQQAERGMLIYQDFAFKPQRKSFTVNGRLAYFSTDSYNSRLYAYENDLLYSFSVPALYGDGIRAYLNFQQKLGTGLSLWFKGAITNQFNKGEGETSGDSSTKAEVKIQVRYQF